MRMTVWDKTSLCKIVLCKVNMIVPKHKNQAMSCKMYPDFPKQCWSKDRIKQNYIRRGLPV